jgi:hypothetical protein
LLASFVLVRNGQVRPRTKSHPFVHQFRVIPAMLFKILTTTSVLLMF